MRLYCSQCKLFIFVILAEHFTKCTSSNNTKLTKWTQIKCICKILFCGNQTYLPFSIYNRCCMAWCFEEEMILTNLTDCPLPEKNLKNGKQNP